METVTFKCSDRDVIICARLLTNSSTPFRYIAEGCEAKNIDVIRSKSSVSIDIVLQILEMGKFYRRYSVKELCAAYDFAAIHDIVKAEDVLYYELLELARSTEYARQIIELGTCSEIIVATATRTIEAAAAGVRERVYYI